MHIIINGRPVAAAPGTTVAAAVAATGDPTRISVTGAPRGPLCGMGICFECRVTINGRPHQRSCQIPVAEGMQISTALTAPPATRAAAPSTRGDGRVDSARSDRGGADQREASGAEPPAETGCACALLIVGAGPAGLAAARAAAAHGCAVTLVDDNPAPGGQIWRATQPSIAPGVTFLPQTRIVDVPAPGRLRADTPAGALDLAYQQLILATGARERFLPFPGWTLPHVLGAGGLQAMAKGGLPIAGRRVVIAGTGPLLVAVAAWLRRHGARIVALCDQAAWSAQLRFLARLPFSKLRQGIGLAAALRGVPVWMNAWPIAAAPGEVTIQHGAGRTATLACDYLACGFHLVPNIDLAQLLGCATQNGFVVVDERQQTTIPGVFCAGEPTAIGGLELAEAEGELAGLAAAGVAAPAPLLSRREQYRRFAARLEACCALRPELRSLAQPDTLVCRCEDVPHARLAAHPDWRSAKLHTRCGMGPCQGRICSPACHFLFAWPPPPPRPPLSPVPLAVLEAPAIR